MLSVMLSNSYGASAQQAAAATTTSTSALTFQSISAGASHTCGLRTDGVAVCWGSNHWGSVDAAVGYIHIHKRRLGAYLWTARKRRCGVLGL